MRRTILGALLLSSPTVVQADPSVIVPDGALPAGTRLNILLGQEWLPEPAQSRIYNVPPVGTPVTSCLSVVKLSAAENDLTPTAPITIRFSCDNTIEHPIAYAFINGTWQPVSMSLKDGQLVISANELTTYVLLSNPSNS